MIKIIKQGTRKTATCEKCGCVFSYENEDINIESEVYPKTIKDDFVFLYRYCFRNYVRCPQCNVEVEIVATR